MPATGPPGPVRLIPALADARSTAWSKVTVTLPSAATAAAPCAGAMLTIFEGTSTMKSS